MLRIAVQSKGRLYDETMMLLEEAGIKLNRGKRILLLSAKGFPVEVLFLRDDDIPQSVANGVADIGIVGENEYVEKNLNSLRSVAIRAYDLMAANHNRSQSALCDWLIESHHISQYSTFERDKQRMDEIFDLGYQAAARTFKNHQDKFAKAIL